MHLPNGVLKRRGTGPAEQVERKPEEYGAAALYDGLCEISHDLLQGKTLWQQEHDGLRVQLQQLPDRLKGLLIIAAEKPERISFCLELTAVRKRIQFEVVKKDGADLVFELGVELGTSRETLGVRNPGSETSLGSPQAPQGLYYANQIWQVLDSISESSAA